MFIDLITRTPLIIEFAKTIQETCNWSLLPIIADAIEEAGCKDDLILYHFRWCGDFEIHSQYGICWMIEALVKPMIGSVPNIGYCGIPTNDNGEYRKYLEARRKPRERLHFDSW